MNRITRFGVSLEGDLLGAFDALIEKQGYPNRSEALRDLIREALRGAEVSHGTGTHVAALLLLYDHERAGLTGKINHIFHHQVARTVASMHIHVNTRLCLEVIILKGTPTDLRALGSKVRAMKGVLLGDLHLIPARRPAANEE